MGIGFALGGIAKGIQDQQELGMKNNALALQTQELKSNDAYRNASLGLEQKRLDATTSIETANKAREIYNGLLEKAKQIIEKGFSQGKDVNWAADLMNKMGPEITSMGQAAGIDPNATAAEVKGILTSGITPEPRIGAAWEAVQAKIAQSGYNSLTPGEQDLAKVKMSELKAMMAGGGGAGAAGAGDLPSDNLSPPGAPPAAPAPAAAAAPPAQPMMLAPPDQAPAAPPPAPHPAVPPSLIGKVIAWSDKTQRFYDKAGVAYNQQGVPVPQ